MSNSNAKLLTIPIYSLLVYVISTFFPLIYSYFPILGKLRITLLSGAVLIISYWFTKSKYNQPDVYGNSIFLSYLLFFLVMLCGLFVSIDKGLTLSFLEVSVKYFIIMAIMIKIIDNYRRMDVLLAVFAACGACMALSSVYNFISGQTVTISGYTRSRSLYTGIFGDPNDLALLFNTTLPFMLYFWVKAKKKLIPFLCTVITIAAVVLTFSRGGFVGLCAMWTAFILLHARKQKKYLIYFLIIVWAGYIFSPPEYHERIASIVGWEVDRHTGETGTRLDAWKIVLSKSLAEHPILGAGAGCSIYLAGRTMGDWHLIHSTYIQVISETGLLGIFFYLLLYYFPFKQYRAYARSRESDPDEELLRYRMILVSFCSYGVTAAFLPQAYSPIFYILIGIAIIQRELVKGEHAGMSSTPAVQ